MLSKWFQTMRTEYDIEKIPASHRQDMKRAIKILEDVGCEEIYIFGSMVDGPVTPDSDIDIAAKGIPHGFYFKTLARLMMQLDHPVDLVPMERDNRFADMLQHEGHLYRVI